MTSQDSRLVDRWLKWLTSCATSVASEACCCTDPGYTVAGGLAASAGVGEGSLVACNPPGACRHIVGGSKRQRRRRRHSSGQTLARCQIDSGISWLEIVQNHRYSEKDLEVGMNEGDLVKETGPSAALRREMKKIEALLAGRPCLEDKRYTVVDIPGDWRLAFGLVAGGLVADSRAPGFEGLDGAGWDTVERAIELETEREGACSARRVADSTVVETLAQGNNPFGGSIVGRILLALDPMAVNTRLCLLRAPCPDFLNRYGRFVTIPVEDG